MALSVVLTIDSTPYDVADYVMKDSIIIDESLFNDKDLRPTTNKASFILQRACPYIDELFAWADDVPITISLDSVLAFTGYLTDDHSLSIGTTGAREVKIDAEDPGIRKLKVSWVSTDTLSTIFNGDKVCDPADTGNSFVHILAGLAGVNLATMPTISAPLYFTVKDSDSKDYWGILADVLFEHQYVFYFNAAGELALFSLASLTGTPAQMVSTSADVLAKNGDVGIKVTKRLLTWKQVDVKFKEAETLAGAVIYRDTTGQTAINDCDIPLAGGAYYPSTCDASTYAYIDYFLEDGREILSVGSAASAFVVDSGITAEYLNLGLSARVRFLNTLGITADIRKLKVAGANVVAVKAQSKVIAGESSKFKKEYEAKYLTDKTKATELANLLYYFYKNSSSTYKWRSYMGTLYPSETLFPAATLFPLGDLIALGEKIDLKDPVFSGLDVDVAVTKRRYRLGYYGADYEGVGIGTITLSSAVGYTPTAPAIVPGPKYLATRPLAADPAGASPDTADFIGQYGVYAGQRYTCTALPDTWALDDAGQTAAQVVAAVPVYVPRYLGPVLDGVPSYAREGDVYLLYSATANTVDPPTIADPPDHRGVFKYTSSAWVWTTDPADITAAGWDIAAICLMKDNATPPAPLYGDEADYGVTLSSSVAHFRAAIVDILRVGDITIEGLLKSEVMDTIAASAGDTIANPTPTYWPGSSLITACAGLADGWHAVENTSTMGGKNVTHAVKGGADNTVSYQASDAEVISEWGSLWLTQKTINSAVSGSVRVFADYYNGKIQIRKNGVAVYESPHQSAPYITIYADITIEHGDVLTLHAWGSYVRTKNFRLCPAPSTIGLWNDTDDTALSVNNTDYYNVAGSVDLTGIADFITTAIDDYYPGSALIALFAGKAPNFVEITGCSDTFDSKTVSSIYLSGSASIRITFDDASTLTILSTGYYNATGSVILPTVEARVLLGNPDTIGEYELWPHEIPGSTNEILTVRNRTAADAFSILEVRAPDKSSGDSESTLSLHGVVGTADYVNDKSLHNYAGDMCALDVLSNFGTDALGDWKQVAKRTVSAWEASTAYTAAQIRTNDTGKVYLCTGAGTSAASGGPTGTGLVITDGGATWQYLGTSTAGVWEKLISQIYSATGQVWYSGGRKPAGTLNGTKTSGEIFTALAPCIPNAGDTILVTGGGNVGGALLVFSHAERVDATNIRIYSVQAGSGSYWTIQSGGSVSSACSLAW